MSEETLLQRARRIADDQTYCGVDAGRTTTCHAAWVLEEMAEEIERLTRNLDIVRGNAERWEKLALQYKRELEQSSDEVADTVADQPRQDCLPGADICSNDWHRLKFVDTDWCPDCAMTVDEVNVALRDRALQEQSSDEN